MGPQRGDPFETSPHVLRLPGRTSSPRAARDFVTGVIAGWGARPARDVGLATSEVVTNAVLHAGGDIAVRVRRVDGHARVEVHDDDPRPPAVRRYEPGAIGGAGMNLVAALAACWGVTTVEGDGKVVWFDIEVQR
ncbi:MAG TPA: ATP-binding protein [Acidimicrobiales bacterium]